MHSLIQSRPQTQPHHHHHHHHHHHDSHRHHRNHHHNHHRCWRQHCFQHHLSLIYRQHHRPYNLSPSISYSYHSIFWYHYITSWCKHLCVHSRVYIIETISIRSCSTTPSLNKLHKLGEVPGPLLLSQGWFQVASPEVPWSSEWQSFSVAVWAVNLQTFSFMWLIRAIDCQQLPCLSVPKPTSPHHWPLLIDFACSFGKALSNNGLDVFALPML